MFSRKKKNKTSKGSTILGGIAQGALDIGGAVVEAAGDAAGAVADVGGSAAEGVGGCLEGCFGCATVIVIVAVPMIGMMGWGAYLIV